MRKISSYLYPNRVQLLADLAAFNVEYSNVYQRNVKIYNGVDNTIEFDIKNADQKRIDLAVFQQINLTVMDAAGNELPNSPYTITPTSLKGIATVTIPQEDLADLTDQFLRYSVTALQDSNDVILYADTRFGMAGTIELDGTAMPTFREDRVYDTFTGEIDLDGNVINHTSAIPATFYEAIPTTQMSFAISVTGFIGTVWLEGTTKGTINVEAFKNAVDLRSQTISTATTTTIEFNNVDIGDFRYFRVYYQGDNPLNPTGTVDKVLVS